MLVNKCIEGCSSAKLIEETLPVESNDKKIYHIALTSGKVNDYEEEIKNFILQNNDVDGIILDCTAEGPEELRIKKLLALLEQAGYSKDKIFYIDSGLNYFDFCNHGIVPNWIAASCHYLPELQSINPVETRTILFLALARLAKYQRLQFIIKMIQNGLDKESILSCGSGDEEITVSEVFKDVPVEIRHLFPIIPNGTKISRHEGSTGIDPIFKKCLINIVLESNYENNLFDISGPPSHCWDRLFYTEKTDKCFYMEQMPIFLAKTGYVAELRRLGFDLFDDIIDHSYDNEINPYIRIDSVISECKRLHEIGISNLLTTYNISERLARNKLLPIKIREQYYTEFKYKLIQWALQLV
jgi:hypothetical protein